MGILNLIFQNIFRKPHTRRPDAIVPAPAGFRGDLQHDPALCTACETCAYVCSPSAITFERINFEGAAWQYQMMQCTYCGRCVDYCPTHALSFQQQPNKVVHTLSVSRHMIRYQSCERCGEPIVPLPRAVLQDLYGGSVPADLEHLNRLCARCRKMVHSENIKRGFTGK